MGRARGTRLPWRCPRVACAEHASHTGECGARAHVRVRAVWSVPSRRVLHAAPALALLPELGGPEVGGLHRAWHSLPSDAACVERAVRAGVCVTKREHKRVASRGVVSSVFGWNSCDFAWKCMDVWLHCTRDCCADVCTCLSEAGMIQGTRDVCVGRYMHRHSYTCTYRRHVCVRVLYVGIGLNFHPLSGWARTTPMDTGQGHQRG